MDLKLNNKKQNIMAHKTVYKCNVSGNQLEIYYSDKGIHFNINQEDNTYLCELVFDEGDMFTMMDEIQMYQEFIKEEKQ
jgi:hypothetical protein